MSNVASTLLPFLATMLPISVAENGNNVEKWAHSTLSKESFNLIVAFDNVASTLLLVWTGLKYIR